MDRKIQRKPVCHLIVLREIQSAPYSFYSTIYVLSCGMTLKNDYPCFIEQRCAWNEPKKSHTKIIASSSSPPPNKQIKVYNIVNSTEIHHCRRDSILLKVSFFSPVRPSAPFGPFVVVSGVRSCDTPSSLPKTKPNPTIHLPHVQSDSVAFDCINLMDFNKWDWNLNKCRSYFRLSLFRRQMIWFFMCATFYLSWA